MRWIADEPALQRPRQRRRLLPGERFPRGFHASRQTRCGRDLAGAGAGASDHRCGAMDQERTGRGRATNNDTARRAGWSREPAEHPGAVVCRFRPTLRRTTRGGPKAAADAGLSPRLDHDVSDALLGRFQHIVDG